MSYHKARNKENKFEVVNTANKIYKYTIKLCVKLPKRYTFLVSQKIANTAYEVMENARVANSIFPSNRHETQMRKNYWSIARAKLQVLSTSINYFADEPDILTYKDEVSGKVKRVTKNELNQLADVIAEEQTLLTNIMKSDKERFANLT